MIAHHRITEHLDTHHSGQKLQSMPNELTDEAGDEVFSTAAFANHFPGRLDLKEENSRMSSAQGYGRMLA
jgi:hypothetical protein